MPRSIASITPVDAFSVSGISKPNDSLAHLGTAPLSTTSEACFYCFNSSPRLCWKYGLSVLSRSLPTEGFHPRPTWHASGTQQKKFSWFLPLLTTLVVFEYQNLEPKQLEPKGLRRALLRSNLHQWSWRSMASDCALPGMLTLPLFKDLMTTIADHTTSSSALKSTLSTDPKQALTPFSLKSSIGRHLDFWTTANLRTGNHFDWKAASSCSNLIGGPSHPFCSCSATVISQSSWEKLCNASFFILPHNAGLTNLARSMSSSTPQVGGLKSSGNMPVFSWLPVSAKPVRSWPKSAMSSQPICLAIRRIRLLHTTFSTPSGSDEWRASSCADRSSAQPVSWLPQVHSPEQTARPSPSSPALSGLYQKGVSTAEPVPQSHEVVCKHQTCNGLGVKESVDVKKLAKHAIKESLGKWRWHVSSNNGSFATWHVPWQNRKHFPRPYPQAYYEDKKKCANI